MTMELPIAHICIEIDEKKLKKHSRKRKTYLDHLNKLEKKLGSINQELLNMMTDAQRKLDRDRELYDGHII